MGRLWHTLLLAQWKEILPWIPVETLVKERQEEYYEALGKADKEADSTVFVEFMLTALRDALKEIPATDQDGDQETDQVKKLLQVLADDTLTAVELMERLNLKHRPTFRNNYLKPALAKGLIEMTIPDKPNSKNQKYRKTK